MVADSGRLVDWLNLAATLVVGSAFALVLAYFQSPDFRDLVRRGAARALVFSRDRAFLVRYVTPLVLALLGVCAVSGAPSRRLILAMIAGWSLLSVSASWLGRRRAASIRSFVAGKPDAQSLALAPYEQDGSTLIEHHAERDAIRLCSDDAVNYVYFKLSPRARRALRRAASVVFVVEYADERETVKATDVPCWLNYDHGEAAPYKRAYCQGVVGEWPWRLAFFQTHGADFDARQQDGAADFRIAAFDIDLWVSSIHTVALPR